MKKRFINYFFSKRILSALTAMLIISGSVYGSSVPLFAAEAQPEEAPESADTTVLPVITAIAPLSDSEAEVSFSDKPSLDSIASSLPPELSVFFDNGESPVPLSVTWECGDDYENTDFDIYEFTPLWDTEAYPLAPSIEPAADIPHITVYVSQETASIRLLNAEEAMSGLSSLAKEKDIYALLYLCDTYEAVISKETIWLIRMKLFLHGRSKLSAARHISWPPLLLQGFLQILTTFPLPTRAGF